MKLSVFFRWYDFWVGFYWDRAARALYVCPVPMLGVRIQLGGAANAQRTHSERQAPPVTFPALVPLAPPTVIHLVTHPENRPLCGASIREAWTEDPAFATCPACRRDGDLRFIQWKASTR